MSISFAEFQISVPVHGWFFCFTLLCTGIRISKPSCINDPAKWPVQVILRQIVILASALTADTSDWAADDVTPPAQTVKMAVIVVATLPILIVYPFLQKHFAKGALLGSIKGRGRHR
jgi:ABC-type glycerol-3-phosphate transport system permease component